MRASPSKEKRLGCGHKRERVAQIAAYHDRIGRQEARYDV
jgi:hypothetical protein